MVAAPRWWGAASLRHPTEGAGCRFPLDELDKAFEAQSTRPDGLLKVLIQI